MAALVPESIIVSATRKDSVWLFRSVRLAEGDLAVTYDQTRSLTSAEAEALERAIRESHFWSATRFNDPPPEVVLFDGGTITMEGRRNGDYQFVERWDPRDEPVRSLAEILFRFAGTGARPFHSAPVFQ